MKIKVRCYDEEAETMFYSDQEYDDHFFELNDKGELRCWRIDESDGTLEEPPEPYSTELENDPELCINLPDKNGKPIFEGDILNVEFASGRGVVAVVKFNDGCFDVVCNNITMGRDYLKCYTINRAVEIIGNTHENPELLTTSD